MNEKITGDLKYILHSICHIAVLEESNNNIEYNDFISNFYLMDINILHLQQIGEMVSRLSEEFKIKHSEIDFINIKGLRNIVVHNYDGLDYEDIYTIIKEDIPDLKNKYKNILKGVYNLTEDFIEDYINYFIKSRKFKDIL